jgi:hypothetical protein
MCPRISSDVCFAFCHVKKRDEEAPGKSKRKEESKGRRGTLGVLAYLTCY